MKIGILTFHWATNYGAVLQAYSLQQYLKEQGHDVEIIDYKPWRYDFFKRYLIAPWLLLRLRKDIVAYKKEQKLAEFKKKYLVVSNKRFYSYKSLSNEHLLYDVVICGSDQVLNPSFTLSGENKPTSAYFLTFVSRARKVGYAVSFGCTNYPKESLLYAKQWINSFDSIGVRENSGIDVLSQMCFAKGKEVVPDPTILYGKKLFENMNIENPSKRDYLCVYVLRSLFKVYEKNVVYIDDLNNPLSMEQWLGTIIGSSGLVTNSYHGMIMAILNHIPFVVLLETKRSGMNDRFVTLLSKIGLENRICKNIDDYQRVMDGSIDWDEVDNKIENFRKVGEIYLKTEINQ